MPSKFKKHGLIFIKGMIIGASDVVPGASGGLAIVLKVYEKMIEAFRSFNLELLKVLRSQGIKAAWQHIHGNFLLAFFAGIITSIISLAKLITWILENYPPLIWSFFFGLLVASTIVIAKSVRQWNIAKIFLVCISAVIVYYITLLSPSSTPDAWWFVMLSGSIAITAIVLPGISGSFLLILLGKYHYILAAVKNLDLPVMVLFALGCGIGLMISSRIIHWLLHHYHDYAMAAIVGFMLGSLNKIWPWKITTEWIASSDGFLKPLVEHNVSPSHYAAVTGEPSYTILAFVLLFIGLAFILGVQFLSERKNTII